MPQASANGIVLEYESWGDAAGSPIVLIMGLGMQLTSWRVAFRDGLVQKGFRVIAFDNRDAGLSTRVRVGRRTSLRLQVARAWMRLPVNAPYTLDDMAADTVGLLDALAIERAHVVGASMGGMIGQLVAARHPARTASLTSIMSSSGIRHLAKATREARRALLSRPEDPNSRESVTRHMIEVANVIGSPAFPKDQAELRERIERSVRRAHYPEGVTHQLLAVLASGDRRPLLRTIVAPTLVIHGGADPVMPAAAAHDTARHVRGARLMIFDGMGHDFPSALVPVLVDAIASHCRDAEARA